MVVGRVRVTHRIIADWIVHIGVRPVLYARRSRRSLVTHDRTQWGRRGSRRSVEEAMIIGIRTRTNGVGRIMIGPHVVTEFMAKAVIARRATAHDDRVG